MVTPTISPPEAAAAGCTATWSVNDRRDYQESGYQGWIQNYKFEATAVTGYKFDHWEWRHAYSTPSGTTVNDITDHSNPCVGESLSWRNTYCESEAVYSGGRTYTGTISNLVAVFVASEKSITVNASVSPHAAEAIGCSVSPGTQTKKGLPGTSTTFTIEASEAGRWKFRYWKDDNGFVVSNDKTYTFQKAFANVDQVFSFTAFFDEVTGEILHGASGTIIFGSSGTILFKG